MTYESLNKQFLYLSRKFIVELIKLFGPAILGPPWLDLQKKSHVEIGRFDEKNHLFTL